eukprot:365727-Chlamydomonas_euryale.AAC.7
MPHLIPCRTRSHAAAPSCTRQLSQHAMHLPCASKCIRTDAPSILGYPPHTHGSSAQPAAWVPFRAPPPAARLRPAAW